MGSGLFGIGISGLSAAQAGLVTTGHNIANASTPGYHRQQTVQQNGQGLLTGAGFFGQGVQVDTVRRIYSDFLDRHAIDAQAQASYYAAYSTNLAQIDSLLSDPSAGLAPELQRFFEGVHEVASNPGSIPSRQAMLSSAEALTTRFEALDTRLAEMNDAANAQIESTVSSINAYARQIADLNKRITMAQVDPSQPPNDLLDQRDQLISELNNLVGTTVIQQNDGTVNVAVGTGQSLVVGERAFSLVASRSTENPNRVDIFYSAGVGSNVILPDRALTGGSLAAVLSFRSGPLTNAQNELGRIAAGIALAFNAQHRLGQDINGTMGGDFFRSIPTSVTARTNNAGSAVIGATLTSASGLQASDYRLTFTGGNYQLTRLRDNTTTTYATLPQTVDGMTISLTSGVPANGDSFMLEPVRRAARELSVALTNPVNIAAAAPIRTAAGTGNAGTGKVSPGVVNPPLDANLQQPVTITFTAANTFNVTGVGTGNPVGLAYTPGGNITYNGWTIQINGAPSAGDTFTVGPNTNGTSDARNADILANLQLANTLNGGTTSFQEAYGQITSSIGNVTRETEIAAQAQEAIALRAREAQQSVSGVNLDEEAANLLRYQQAFEASGKVIEIASRLFDTLLDIGR